MADGRSSPFRSVILFALLPCIAALATIAILQSTGQFAKGGYLSILDVSVLAFLGQDWLGALAFMSIVIASWFISKGRNGLGPLLERLHPGRFAVPIIAFTGAVAVWLTALVAFRGYALSLDEFLPTFQAEIFRSGKLLAPVPSDLWPLHRYLQTSFTYTDAEHGLWGGHYRPGHSLLLALAPSLGGVNLLNAIMTAISVFALSSIVRRLWPNNTEIQVVACLLLLASPQVIVTGGSGFSFTTHLAFNLVWLALFLKGAAERRLLPHLGAALVGSYAIGLHQVHFHPIFAFPFLTLLVFGAVGRRRDLLTYAVSYATALPFWVLWPELAVWATTGDASVLPRSLMEVDYIANYLSEAKTNPMVAPQNSAIYLIVNLLRFVLWLSPAVIILVIAALSKPGRVGVVVWAALAGVILNIVLSHLLMPNQMQTWGTRYYHPVIGNAILIASAGYVALRESRDDALARRLSQAIPWLVVLSLIVLLPLRLVQVHAKVAPRAAVADAVASVDADIVVIPPLPIWFMWDFVRNDPFLKQRPLILAGYDEDWRQFLLPARNETVRVLTIKDFEAFGLPTGTFDEPGPPYPE